jgi:hypothetical protein
MYCEASQREPISRPPQPSPDSKASLTQLPSEVMDPSGFMSALSWLTPWRFSMTPARGHQSVVSFAPPRVATESPRLTERRVALDVILRVEPRRHLLVEVPS